MRRRHFFLFALLITAAFFAWRLGKAPEKSPGLTEIRPTPPTRREPAVITPPVVPPRANSSDAAGEVAMPRAEIARIVEANAQPGRMVFVAIRFTPQGASALRAAGAAGRAKPRPLQHGPGWLQYEVYSPTGQLTLSGSVDDPLHQRLEYERADRDHALRATLVDHDEGILDLRLPGEAAAARVVFFREITDVASAGTARESAGEVVLR